jgi:hypothetical protein
MSKEETIWAVVVDLTSPKELDSLWWDEQDAINRCAKLNEEGVTSWNVEDISVGGPCPFISSDVEIASLQRMVAATRGGLKVIRQRADNVLNMTEGWMEKWE